MKFKLLICLFITLLFTACPFMGDPPSLTHSSHDYCSEYSCGDNGKCIEEKDIDSMMCNCNEGYTYYEFEVSETELEEKPRLDMRQYCSSKPKQLILSYDYDTIGLPIDNNFKDNHQLLLSNNGNDIPKSLDKKNKYLYYSDIAKFYGDFYLVDDYHTVKLLDENLDVKGEVYFDKKIKEIVKDYTYQNLNFILFTDNTIETYGSNFSYKFSEFTSGEEIIELSSKSYITKNKDFIYYKIENGVVVTEKVEKMSPSLGIINGNCSFMGENNIKCFEISSVTQNLVVNRAFTFIPDDETVIFVKDSCTYTDKNRLYCNISNGLKFKENVFIETRDKDQYGNTDKEFCYLTEYRYECIKYGDMAKFE